MTRQHRSPVGRAGRSGSARAILLAVGALVVLAAAFLLWAPGAGTMRAVTAGAPAPEFRARTLDATPQIRTLADYQGQVVLLNLWASWCVPCEQEMPSIERLYREFGPAGLKVVGVAVDDPGFEDRVRGFVARHGLTFDILSEGSGKIESDYQALGIPATYLIGRDGIIRKRVAGASDWSSAANQALVAQLLGVPVPSHGTQ
jgi:cytochrome c biogenesis protein CcmG/thiol:disulfide interchange protein DsbE